MRVLNKDYKIVIMLILAVKLYDIEPAISDRADSRDQRRRQTRWGISFLHLICLMYVAPANNTLLPPAINIQYFL